ncbi:MAG: type II toxin-antitoxin system VapC family toxin [Chromatiaceae bacterium]
MIVVDTNIITYLLLPTPITAAAEALYQSDPGWAAPLLWRSEFRNVLALYMRKGSLPLDGALALQERAEDLVAGREFQVQSTAVLRLARSSGCSAYDCEFVAVAQDLHTRLYTADKGLLRAFPDLTVALNETG